jgi:ChaB
MMLRSSRYRMSAAGELPGTLRRSSEEAQEAFRQAREEAIRAYGEGDQAAYAALKEKFQKCGDHWVAKAPPVADSR